MMESGEHQQTPEQPEMVVLSRNLYPEGTFGHEFFPEGLEGRVRPSDFAASREIRFGKKTTQELQDHGLSDIEGLLNTDLSVLDVFPTATRNRIVESTISEMQEIESRMMISPETHLINAVFGVRNGPIPAEDEIELRETVKEVLDLAIEKGILNEREVAMLCQRFGLDMKGASTLEEVAASFDVTRERVRQIEQKSLARLRRPGEISESLRKHCIFPPCSVGHQLGYTYLGDVPKVKVDFSSLKLSDEAIESLLETNQTHYAANFGWKRFINDATGKLYELSTFANLSLPDDYPPQHKQELLKRLTQAASKKMQLSEAFDDLQNEIVSAEGEPERVILTTKPTTVLPLHIGAQKELRELGVENIGDLVSVLSPSEIKWQDSVWKWKGNVTDMTSKRIGYSALVTLASMEGIVESLTSRS